MIYLLTILLQINYTETDLQKCIDDVIPICYAFDIVPCDAEKICKDKLEKITDREGD